MELKDTVNQMLSSDYKERFKAEYFQTKIRYEKLRKFNRLIEAAKRTKYNDPYLKVEEPLHDCPYDVLSDQLKIMDDYLHVLEVRAFIEGIDLTPDAFDKKKRK